MQRQLDNATPDSLDKFEQTARAIALMSPRERPAAKDRAIAALILTRPTAAEFATFLFHPFPLELEERPGLPRLRDYR